MYCRGVCQQAMLVFVDSLDNKAGFLISIRCASFFTVSTNREPNMRWPAASDAGTIWIAPLLDRPSNSANLLFWNRGDTIYPTIEVMVPPWSSVTPSTQSKFPSNEDMPQCPLSALLCCRCCYRRWRRWCHGYCSHPCEMV